MEFSNYITGNAKEIAKQFTELVSELLINNTISDPLQIEWYQTPTKQLYPLIHYWSYNIKENI